MKLRTLQRVILLALLIAFVSGAWFWETPEAKPPKKKSKSATDVEGPDDAEPTVSPSGKKKESRYDKLEKKGSKTTNAEKVKMKRKFQQTMPDNLQARDVKAAIESDLFDETMGAEDEDGVSDKEITKMWAEHMHDFVPEDMVNFIIPNGEHRVLFETIGHTEPTKVKGAYYVKGGNKNKYVSVLILDPMRQVIYYRKQAPQHIILFDTTKAGEYSFIFGNFWSREDITVTMALHTYETRKEEPIEYDLDDDGNRVIRGQ